MHTSLDVIGILLEPTDALNAVLYLMEGDKGNAALSGISMLPFMGEQFGKAGKGAKKYLLKAADATKLNRGGKIVKMLDNLDIFIKARKADIEDIRRWMRSLDNLADGGDYVIEYVTPGGLIYKVCMNDDFRVNINLMDESGDTLQNSVKLGKNGRVFLEDAKNHLEVAIKFDRKATKGLIGCHNKDAFYAFFKEMGLEESEFIEKIVAHPTIEGIYEITYKIEAIDIYGKSTGRYKIFKLPKTVYDPSVISTEQIMEWGKVALDSKDAIIKGRIIEGVAPNGLKFRGYLNDMGEITNFHPIFEGR